jgi:general secretion pathway protein D
MNRRVAPQAASGAGLFRSVLSGSFLLALVFGPALIGLSSVSLHAESASSDYKRGQNAEAREDYDAAVDFYQKACTKAPKDVTYRTSFYRVRVSASGAHLSKGRKLLQAGDEQGALTEFLHAAEVDPSNEAAQQEIARVRQKHGEVSPQTETSLPQAPGTEDELASMGSPVQLRPVSDEPLTLHMTEDAKVIYQAIGKAAGINVLFDPDYTAKRVQVDLNNVSLLDALRIAGTMSNTFWRPVTSNTIFVAANTQAKRREQDEQAVQTFYLSNAWQQTDLTDVVQAIRNVLGGNPSFKVYQVPSQNAVVVRGSPDELLMSQLLIDDLDKARAEVVVDIAVLEVSKNWEKTIGIEWPNSVGVAIQPPNSTSSTTSTTGTTTGTSSATPTLYSLANLQATDFAVTIGSATANLLLSDSNTKIIQNPRIRATDGQKATLTVGEKIPVATGSYQTGAATAVVSSLVNTQFQYQEVGVKVEMTPSIHFDRDITLKIKIEVSSEAGSSTISGVTEPIIAQNIVDQVIRLREGEASILGGIKQTQDEVSWTGIPGLSSIPFLKYLFGSKDHTIQDSDLVFLVVPHIVRTQSLDKANLRTVDLGVGQTIELRRIPVQSPDGAEPGAGSSPAPAAAPVRPVPAQSTVGTVPGQSAMAAAPAALKQLDDAANAGSYAANASRPPDIRNPALPAAPPPPPGSKAPVHPMPVNLILNGPSVPLSVGSTFMVPVGITGGTDIASVATQIHYDPAKLSLVNVSAGNFLNRGGQSADPIHLDDGKGTLTVNASRPPGAPGASGPGVVYVVSFQAKAAGESVLVLGQMGVADSAHNSVPVQGSQLRIVVK